MTSKSKHDSVFTVAIRHSGEKQYRRNQHVMLNWAGVLLDDFRVYPKVYLRSFSATLDLTKVDDDHTYPNTQALVSVEGDIWINGEDPPADSRPCMCKDIKMANFFATLSRASNKGVLEYAHDNNKYLCLVDVAVAATNMEISPKWVHSDAVNCNSNSRRLNLKNPYVYATLRAVRDAGHLPYRHVIGTLASLGREGRKAK